MTPVTTGRPLVAIAGNPNVGKTSIFNRLTGLDLKVTNYPGVTVERQEGHVHLRDGTEATVIDIPGTYSLSGRSAEEQIAIAAIAGLPPLEVPDLLVMTIDATQLSRNLYLLLQAIELNVPTVVALTMTDTLADHHRTLDRERLELALGVPVVQVVGHKGTGMDEIPRARGRVGVGAPRIRPSWRTSRRSRTRSRRPGSTTTNSASGRWRSGRCSPWTRKTSSSGSPTLSERWSVSGRPRRKTRVGRSSSI
jgi:ferrous iron transport protein B